MPKYGAHFASMDDQYDVQRAYHFILELTGLDPAGSGSSNKINVFSAAVQSVRIPDMNNNMIEFAHGATKVKFSGQTEFSDVDITIVDFIGVDVDLWLCDWYDKVCKLRPSSASSADATTRSASGADDIGRQNYMTAYKRKAMLLELPPDGNQANARKWELWGMFPTSYQPGNFDYQSNDKKMITMTFSVDYAKRLPKSTSVAAGTENITR